MKVLVIPDVHLKPWMFSRAAELMKEGAAEQAVCLMDIADDWGQERNLDLYEKTYDAAISFAKEFPETLWCYGNHDVCYLWNQRESGYSVYAQGVVYKKLYELRQALTERTRLAFVQRIDNVLFSHGGLGEAFVRWYMPGSPYNDTDAVLEKINRFGAVEMWRDISPIWLRPQYRAVWMYKPEEFLQVVGHTPVKQIEWKENLISCDVFSTCSDGTPIGSREFLLIDTENWEYQGKR